MLNNAGFPWGDISQPTKRVAHYKAFLDFHLNVRKQIPPLSLEEIMEIDKLPPSIEKYDRVDYKILFATRHIDDLYNKNYALWKWTGMEHPGTYNPNLQEAIFLADFIETLLFINGLNALDELSDLGFIKKPHMDFKDACLLTVGTMLSIQAPLIRSAK